jgi:hypothetical protein
MKMRKIGTIIILGFCLRVIISCCNCPETITSKYTFNSIETAHIDNSGELPVYIKNGTISKESYGIQIELSLKQIAINHKLDLSGFSSTHAMTCCCPPEFEYFAQDSMIGINITTLNDFDLLHKENSVISEYFKVYIYSDYYTIQDFLEFPAEMYEEQMLKYILELYLMKSPEIIGEHSFKIDILLSNGTTLTATTTAINLE